MQCNAALTLVQRQRRWSAADQATTTEPKPLVGRLMFAASDLIIGMNPCQISSGGCLKLTIILFDMDKVPRLSLTYWIYSF